MNYEQKSTWLAALAACMFAFENKNQDSGMYYNPDYRVKQPKRNLQSFIINGKTIEAYSRKDAIKRLKHNKLERKELESYSIVKLK